VRLDANNGTADCVPTVNSIRLAYSRESGDASTVGDIFKLIWWAVIGLLCLAIYLASAAWPRRGWRWSRRELPASRAFLAASANPQPAITRLAASMTIGRTKPNCSLLAWSLRICAGGCLRVSAGNGNAIPALRFHRDLPQMSQARITSGQNIMVTSYQQTGPAEFTKLLSSRAPAPRH
jgi:hypothetical protein